MNCTHCGRPMQAGAAFCPGCGAPVSAPAPVYQQAAAPYPAAPAQQQVAPYPAQPAWQQPPPQYPPAAQNYQPPPAYQSPPPYPYPNQAQGPRPYFQQPPPAARASGRGWLSGMAKVWCGIGIAGNGLSFLMAMILYSNDVLVGQAVITALAGLLGVAGYITLLCGKKAGFFILCGAALAAAVANIAFQGYLEAFWSLLSPLITWLLVKDSWR